MNDEIRAMLMRAMAFHTSWGHAPTRAELVATAEGLGDVYFADAVCVLDELIACGEIHERLGRLTFLDSQDLVDEIRACEVWRERKIRVARGVASRLAKIPGVRFVALCNTTALGHANDKSDVDFFVVCRKGTLFTTRGLAALPYKLSRRRPGEEERDAVCLSYFVTDDGLDLSSHMLAPDDPYFRYWFLSLLPLYDDGVGEDLWSSNRVITSRHPFAHKWIAPSDLEVDKSRWSQSRVFRFVEPLAKYLQMLTFPAVIKSLMNSDTRVIVTDKALKFHVDDRREEIRAKYEEICKDKDITSASCHSRSSKGGCASGAEDGNPELIGKINHLSWIPPIAIGGMTNALTKIFFSIAWRLAVLVLPWQTRWFSDASLAGWPWEQGRLSFYASWFIIITATILGFKTSSQNSSQLAPTKVVRPNHFCWFIFLMLFAGSLFFSGGASGAFRAIGQWWAQIFLLGLFVVALRRAAVSHRKITTWFVISLLPHIALGVWQYATQKVVGSSWLGTRRVPTSSYLRRVSSSEYFRRLVGRWIDFSDLARGDVRNEISRVIVGDRLRVLLHDAYINLRAQRLDRGDRGNCGFDCGATSGFRAGQARPYEAIFICCASLLFPRVRNRGYSKRGSYQVALRRFRTA